MKGSTQSARGNVTDDGSISGERTRVHFDWRDHKWSIIAAVWIFALVLGCKGFSDHFQTTGEDASPLRVFYLSLQLFFLESGNVSGQPGWALEVARFFAPAVAAYTAVAALIAVFYDEAQMVRLRFFEDHVIICGLGNIGNLLATAWHRNGRKVVLIEQNESNSRIQQNKRFGVVIFGDATDLNTLRKARVNTAKYIVAACGDDGINAEIAVRASKLADKDRGVLTCFVHIVGSHLYDLLKEHPIMTTPGTEAFRLCPFNIHCGGAQQALNEYPPFDEATANPRVIVVGLGRFGQAVIVETAIRWRLRFHRSNVKIRIEIIDEDATRKVSRLLQRYPFIAQVCDVNANELDIESSAFREGRFLLDGQFRVDASVVYVCLDDDRLGLSAALALLTKLGGRDVPVVVRTTQDKGLATLLREARGEAYRNLYAFELLERTCKPELLGGVDEDLAREFHKAHMELEIERGRETPEWSELPESLRLSNRRQADSLSRILAMAGYCVAPVDNRHKDSIELSEEDIEKLAELEHERFVADRIRDGWQPGPKDPVKKTTRYLVPWDELDNVDPDVRQVDRWWARKLSTALKNVGCKICRLEEADNSEADEGS